jgi:hypothetical protein
LFQSLQMQKLLFLLVINISLATQIQAQTEKGAIENKLDKQATEYLQQKDFEKLHTFFPKKPSIPLPPKHLKKTFSGVFTQFDALIERKGFNVKQPPKSGYDAQAVQFENNFYSILLALDKEDMTAKIILIVQPTGNVSFLKDLLILQIEQIRKKETGSQINDFRFRLLKNHDDRIQKNIFNLETSSAMLTLNLSSSFWLSLKGYHPQKMAKKQPQSCLTLNAERDFQDTPTEAPKSKNESINKPSKTVIYSHVNHLFFAGESVCIPSDYEKESYLQEDFLNNIINWN